MTRHMRNNSPTTLSRSSRFSLFSRRRARRLTMMSVLLTTIVGVMGVVASMADSGHDGESAWSPSSALHPAPAYAQSGDWLFFDVTGHLLDNTYGFLSYWREHNGNELLGAPVTEVVEENGLTVQYFQRGRLEYHDDGQVRAGRIGSDYAAALWRTFDPAPLQQPNQGGYYFEETQHMLNEPFLSFWHEKGGVEAFGYPISEPLWDYVGHEMLQVQYFERGRLERHTVAEGVPDKIAISNLGRDLALLRGHDIRAIKKPEIQALYLPTATPIPTATPLPTATPVPEPTAKPAQPQPIPVSGAKLIEVNLSHQWLYAYQGGTMVFDAPVSTGKDGFNTPVGHFSVYSKIRVQTMSGTIGGEYYYVPNVPHVMYIYGGVAIHGTYWHNQFGTGVRMSHGCINLPLASAEWLYGWAPIGTPVHVHY